MNRVFLVMLALLLGAGPASAHVPIGGAGGLYGGPLHPLYVPAHLLALIGLGLLIGQQERGRVALLINFVVGLAAGLVAIALAAGPSRANDVLIISAAVSGVLVASAWPPPQVIGWPLAAVTGAAIGLDSPPEVVDLSTATVMLIGTGIAAAILVVLIAACAAVLRREWQRIGVRVAGSWMAASAILVLALRLAP